jgi:hypothetical protein
VSTKPVEFHSTEYTKQPYTAILQYPEIALRLDQMNTKNESSRLMKIITIALTALLQCLSVGAQVAGSIDLSDPGAGNNMTFVVETNRFAEAYSIATTMSGIERRHIPEDKYGYFITTNGSILPTDNNLLVSITFYDNTGNFSFQYNSSSGDYTQLNFSKSGTDSWATVTLALTDASFRKAQNNGADFRIFGDNYISRISIEKGTLDPVSERVPSTSPSAYSEFIGKSVTGYQIWFKTGDVASGWSHWNNGPQPRTGIGNFTFELYPDVSDYADSSLTNTGFADLGNGSPAQLFHSSDEDVIETHFTWMQTYGIDGAAVQRFVSAIPPVIVNSREDHLSRVKRAAERTERIFYVMYDVSGGEADWVDRIKFDWVYNVEQNNLLTASPSYATVGGKPVVCLWGTGFGDRPGTAAETVDLINFFKRRGCYVIGGLPTYWRTENNDSKPDFLAAYESYDMISPWTIGRFHNNAAADDFLANLIIPDKAHCDALGIGYLPVIWPGGAWSQWHPEAGPPNESPRNAGDFMWEQARNVQEAGISQAYFAMFDEYDESTALMKAATDWSMVPTDQYFLTLSADGRWLSSDYYLRLTAAAADMIRGSIPNTARIPINHSDGPVYYRNSFEFRFTNCVTPIHNDFYPLDPCFFQAETLSHNNVRNPLVAIQANPAQARSGEYLVEASGSPRSAVSALFYYAISETSIPVTEGMEFSFWKMTNNSLGRYVTVDLEFASGKVLRDLPAYRDSLGQGLHPGDGRGTVGAGWEKTTCLIGTGELLGDTIVRIIIAYDHPSRTGSYSAYFDDFLIEQRDGAITSFEGSPEAYAGN